MLFRVINLRGVFLAESRFTFMAIPAYEIDIGATGVTHFLSTHRVLVRRIKIARFKYYAHGPGSMLLTAACFKYDSIDRSRTIIIFIPVRYYAYPYAALRSTCETANNAVIQHLLLLLYHPVPKIEIQSGISTRCSTTF